MRRSTRPKPGTIAIDFDGVLHSYENGWQGGQIYGRLVEGAKDAIAKLQARRHPLIVFTAREDLEAVADWLIEQTDLDFAVDEGDVRFWGSVETILVTNRKLPAAIYIDDRAHRFRNWRHTSMAIEMAVDPYAVKDRPDVFADSAQPMAVAYTYVVNHGGNRLRKHITVQYSDDGLTVLVDETLAEMLRGQIFHTFLEAFRGAGWGFTARYANHDATTGHLLGYRFNHPVTLTRVDRPALEDLQS